MPRIVITIRTNDEDDTKCHPECEYHIDTFGPSSWCKLFESELPDESRCKDCIDAEKNHPAK